jgi:hypothetical protein
LKRGAANSGERIPSRVLVLASRRNELFSAFFDELLSTAFGDKRRNPRQSLTGVTGLISA